MPAAARLHRPHPTDTPARKPLYLVTPFPAQVEAGGDWLVLRRASAPIQRFPLARIARIICNRNATWTGAALAMCLAEGVSITWLDGHGHAIGSTQPRKIREDTLSARIDLYLELPDWPERLANWAARRRLETLTACATRAAEAGHALDALQFNALKREYVYNGSHPVLFERTGEGWCHALVVERLQREGLQARYWGFDASTLDLAAELAALLWAELNLDCGTLTAGTRQQGSVAARLFEAWASRREPRLLQHIGDLNRHLAREIEAWR